MAAHLLTQRQRINAMRNWHDDKYLEFIQNAAESVPFRYDEIWQPDAYIAQQPLPQDNTARVLCSAIYSIFR